MRPAAPPRLSLMRLVEMNLGFLGLQFSFGLQQANMGPIYGYLGASEANLPLLWLAGPVTGLLVQFAVQAIINLASTVNLIPPKGMTLPFLSYGGSSTIALALSMGMMLALTREAPAPRGGRS